MPVVRTLTHEQSDGPDLGGGTYRLWLNVDQRPSGAEFILSAEVDATERPAQETHYKIVVQGAGTFEGVVPPGGTRRIPETGDASGLRVDGGREYSVALW